MKLDELRTVQSKERRKDSLQQLRDSFYGDVAAYLQDLTASRDRRAEAVDNPFSDDEVRRLSDELETAEEVAEAIYERRVGKVVKLASFAAADMPVDDEGMTTEEQRLFDDLVERISQNKNTVLSVIAGDVDSAETSDSSTESQSTPTATDEPQSTPIPTGESQSTPPEPAEADSSEPPTPPVDSMLADAMGSSTESTVDPTTETPASESPTSASESPTSANGATPDSVTQTDEQLSDDIPPSEPQSEPDTVLERTTDGGTAADTAASSPTTTESTEPTPTTAVEPSTPADESASDSISGNDSISESDSISGDDNDRTTVRITRDVGEIFGVDGREYTLRPEDVVTLPTANADPLVDRDAAMRLD